MGRSSYKQSISSSTRTFETKANNSEAPAVVKKHAKLPVPNLSTPWIRRHLPWLLVVALVLISIFLFFQYREARDKLSSPEQVTNVQQQLDTTLQELSKVAILPTDEKPSVVTVGDPAKLQGQTFFASAARGDKVIVYKNARKAILYRPSTKQVVNIAPLSSSTAPVAQ